MTLLLAAFLSLASVGGPDPAPASSGAVVVLGGGWLGSGVVWDAAARRVLTALHVVEGMPPDAIQVVVPGHGAFSARVVDREASLDLAVLEVATDLEPAPPLGDCTGLLAQDQLALPRCDDLGCGFVRALVLAPARAFAGSRYLAVSAPVAPGWSGGPVLDARGALVGIVDLALLREPDTALAVPIERAAARFPRR